MNASRLKEDIRERIGVILAAIPFAFVLSIFMRIAAEYCHTSTPGWLFVEWYVPSYGRSWPPTGLALLYLLLIDVSSCLMIVLCVYWLLQRWYSGGFERE